MPGEGDTRPSAESPQDRAAELLEDYIARLNAGELLDPQEIARKHPELADELIEQLEAYADLGRERDGQLEAFGDYTITGVLGRGGMGVVYDAWENAMERRVALKVLPAAATADDKTFHRFLREARTAGRLTHPNVVSVHTMGVTDGTPYYAMELVEGETLAELLKQLKQTTPESATVFGEKDTDAYFRDLAGRFAAVAEGLQHAHAKGVIHRDIKPSNLVLDPDGRLRVLDFGLARLEGEESLTLTGHFVGTPAYMSPEQASRRKLPLDHRTDVYSLGATLYELLTLVQPFRGKDHSDTLTRIVEDDPRPPRRSNTKVPAELETIVLKCLRKNVADRYGTAEALAQDLKRFERGDPIEARPTTTWERLTGRLRRHRARAAVLLAVSLLLAVAGWSVWSRRDAEREARRATYDSVVQDAVVEFHSGSLTLTGQVLGGMGFFRALRYMRSPEHLDPAVEELLGTLARAAEATPERPEAEYYLARLFKLLDRDEKAKEHIRRVRENHPEFVPAEVLDMEVDQHAHRLPADDVDLLLRRHRASDTWQEDWLLAYGHASRKNWRAAAAAYGELLAHRERDGDPYVGCVMEATMARGIAALLTKDYDLALQEFAGARRLWPGFIDATLLLGKTYATRGRKEDLAQSERIFGELYREASAEERGERAEWISYMYSGAHTRELRKEWLQRIEGWRRHRYQGRRLMFQGRHVESMEACRAALRVVPDDATSLICLGHSWYWWQHERYGPHWNTERKALLEHAERTAALYPRNNLALSLLAWALLASGRKEDALRAAERIDEIDHRLGVETGIGEWTRARVLRHQGHLAEAKTAIERALKRSMQESTKTKPNPIGIAELARLHEASGNYDEARALYEELTATRTKGWAGSRARLAGLLVRAGEYDKAIEIARRATQLHAKNTPAYENLTEALWKSGDLDEALTTSDTGLTELPGRPRLHFLRGKVLEDLDRPGEALESYVDGLELDPTHDETVRALGALLARFPTTVTKAELVPLRDRLEALHSGKARTLLQDCLRLLANAINHPG